MGLAPRERSVMSPLSASLPFVAALIATPLAAQGAAGPADPAALVLSQIDRAVVGFIAADPAAGGAVALPLDPRLRLAPCRAAFRLSWYGARRDSVRVNCPPAPDQQAPGWRVFVRISGSVAADVAPAPGGAPLVLRGEAVSIAVAGPGFTVARSGEALEPGSLGQWIRVRTAPATAPLRARVSGPGTVELATR